MRAGVFGTLVVMADGSAADKPRLLHPGFAGSSSYPYAGINRIRFNGSAHIASVSGDLASPRSGSNSNAS